MQAKKTIIHFVRHGEIDNPDAIRYGRLPGWHLSANGRKEVEQTSLFFIKRSITHIYSSPLERAQQTATILGFTKPHCPIGLDENLLEVKTLPKFEGKSRDLKFEFPEKPTPDGETMQQVVNRLQAFIEDKVVAHNGQEIIAVSHGDPIGLIWNWLLFKEVAVYQNPYPNFASVVSCVFNGLDCQTVWYMSHLTVPAHR